MSNITLYVPDNVKKRMDSHSEIRWSEVARQAILEKLEETKKLELLRKYVEKEPFTQEDFFWMDEHDWHPVDEKGMKLGFARKVEKARRGRFSRAESADELFE